MKTIVIALCLLFVSAPSFADDVKMPVKLDAPDFSGVLADAGKVFLGGQPSEDALKRLAAEGVSTIINFRTPAEMANRQRVPFDEAEVAKSLGITYIQIPLGGKDYPFKPSAVAAFAEALKKAKGKPLVHCGSAYRASHMWSAYLAKYEGMDINEAIAHGRAANMGTQAVEELLGGNVTYKLETETEKN